MLSFLTVKVPHLEARQIIAYMQIVIDLAQKHAGPGWLSYDALFRQHMNIGGISRWNELNTSLMAATVLSTQGARAENSARAVWQWTMSRPIVRYSR